MGINDRAHTEGHEAHGAGGKEVDTEPMFCPNCGIPLQLSGQKFCARCGGDLAMLMEESGVRSYGNATPPSASSSPAAPGMTLSQAQTPYRTRETPPALPASSMGPIVAGPQELVVAAGCAAVGLVATVLPWYSVVLGSASVSGLQFVFPVIAPVVALIAYWKLHANPPDSLTSGRIYALRVGLIAGIVISAWILIAVASARSTTSYGYTYSTASLAQPSVGIWLYGLACVVGAVFSFKIPFSKGVATQVQSSVAATAAGPSRVARPAEPAFTIVCPACKRSNSESRTVCPWCKAAIASASEIS